MFGSKTVAPEPTFADVYGGVAVVSCVWILMAYFLMPFGPMVIFAVPPTATLPLAATVIMRVSYDLYLQPTGGLDQP